MAYTNEYTLNRFTFDVDSTHRDHTIAVIHLAGDERLTHVKITGGYISTYHTGGTVKFRLAVNEYTLETFIARGSAAQSLEIDVSCPYLDGPIEFHAVYISSSDDSENIQISGVPVATFSTEYETYPITLVAPSNGTLTSDHSIARARETVTLTATPSTGYKFKALTLYTTSTPTTTSIGSNKYTFTMPSNSVKYGVVFEKQTYTLSKSVSPSGGGTVTLGATSVLYQGTTSISASPASGYKFVRWNVSGSGSVTSATSASTTFTMGAANATVTAVFEKYYTNVGAPSNIQLSKTSVTAGTTSITLSWNAASAGVNNPVGSYIIQYMDRTHPSGSWGSWTDLKTVTSTANPVSVDVNVGAKGTDRMYRVGAKGSVSGYQTVAYTTGGTVFRNKEPGVPTSLGITPSLYETGDITLTWSAPSSTTSTVSGYYVSYATASSDSWGSASWSSEASKSSGAKYSLTVTRGYYIRFRIRTKDSMGDYSSYAYFTTIRKNAAPTAPASITVTPAIYEDGGISISWAASTDATGDLAGYKLEWCKTIDGTTYTDWTNLATQSGTTYTHSPDFTEFPRGESAKYRVKAYDSFGIESAYKTSSAIVRNIIPLIPTIVFPVADNKTASVPLVRVNFTADPNGTSQDIEYKVDDGEWQTALSTGASGFVNIHLEGLEDGSHSIAVRCNDGLGISGTVSRTFNVSYTVWDREISAGIVISDRRTTPWISHRDDIGEMSIELNKRREWFGLMQRYFMTDDIGPFKKWQTLMQSLQTWIIECYTEAGITKQSITIPQNPCVSGAAEAINYIRDLIRGL